MKPHKGPDVSVTVFDWLCSLTRGGLLEAALRRTNRIQVLAKQISELRDEQKEERDQLQAIEWLLNTHLPPDAKEKSKARSHARAKV